MGCINWASAWFNNQENDLIIQQSLRSVSQEAQRFSGKSAWLETEGLWV